MKRTHKVIKMKNDPIMSLASKFLTRDQISSLRAAEKRAKAEDAKIAAGAPKISYLEMIAQKRRVAGQPLGPVLESLLANS